MPVNGRVQEKSNAFVISLNDPVAIPPMFNDAISGLLFTHAQPVLVTPANTDWRSAVMVAPEVSAVGAGKFKLPPLLVKIEKVR